MRTMRAAVLYQQNQPLVVETLSVPDPAFGQVLVRIAASGFCHKQLEEIEGKRGHDQFLPHLLGHEAGGVVEQIGDGVTHVKPGDHVVLSWIKGPGINAETPTYYKGEKPINAGWITTFNELALVSENRVTAIRSDMSLDMAALIGCCVPTGAGAVMNAPDLGPDSSVAVFGVGGIGLNAIQAASRRGIGIVIAVDLLANKLDMARDFGATHTINASLVDVPDSVRELTEGVGVDFAIECAGTIPAMELAFESTSKFGGTTVVAGVNPIDARMRVDPNRLHFGQRLIGTSGGESNPAEDYPPYVDAYMDGDLNLDSLVTHRFKLDEINDAARVLEAGEAGRILIIMDSASG